MKLSLVLEDFKGKPFRFIIGQQDLTDEIEKMLKNEETKAFNFVENSNNFLITFNNKQYEITKNPICFKTFLDKNKILFKMFTEDNLNFVLKYLKSTYAFFENNDIIEYKDIKFNSIKEIILVPYLYIVFGYLSKQKMDMEGLKNFSHDELEIKQFILEPYLILLDEYNNLNKFNLILNKERKKFIEEIVDYINIENTYEPMIIVGNDGIGKSVSLQYLSNFNLNSPILYFNFKFMETYGLIEYISLELMKGFLNKNTISSNDNNSNLFFETKIKNFSKYIDFLKMFQKNAQDKNFWEILGIILDDEILKSSILIIDQFKNESQFYNGYDKFITLYRNKKIILCYTLNDSYNKETLFSLLNKTISKNISKKYSDEIKESNSIKDDIKNNDEEEDNVDETEYFKNFICFKNCQIKKISNKGIKKDEIKDEKNEIKKNIPINSNILLGKKRTIKKDEDDEILIKMEKIKIKETNKEHMIEAKKLYYNNLINIEDIIEDIDIKECLFYFNYSPKYYSKFLKFKKKQEEINNKNIKEIIQKFYEEQLEKIDNNIKRFYLNINKKRQKKNLPLLNEIEILMKLKKVVESKKEINFFKLGEYSNLFCFKYLYLTECNNNEEEKKNYINLNDKNNCNKIFILNYSSIFIKIAIEKIINDIIENKSIEIDKLSGSAFGNVLEFKFKEEIVKNKYFNNEFIYRQIWNFKKLNNKLKQNKFKELYAKKINKNIPYFYKIEEDLDDIINDKITLDGKFYYINPKSQINKNFDSLILVKTNEEKVYDMIMFQHTKYKDKSKIKLKYEYMNYAEKNVKLKFEELYDIKIMKIYFYYILSNEDSKNSETCKILDEYKIGYLFYSIKDNIIYRKRSEEKVKDIFELMIPKNLIFSKNNIDNKGFNFKIYMINIIENIIKEKLNNKEKINYEKIRNEIIPHSIGPKINNELKNEIIKKIKLIKNISEPIDFLYYSTISYSLFSFSYMIQEDLFYIFRISKQIYLYYYKNLFIIDVNEKKIREIKKNLFDLFDEIYNQEENAFIKIEEENELNNIPDLNKGLTNIFLYKLYKLNL